MADQLPADLPRDMTVDAFLDWAEARPGRFELELGRVIAMAPERASHNRAKRSVQRVLETAVNRAGLDCETFADGMTVRIDRTTAYEPDAMVRCGPALPPDALEVPRPVVVVEVSSPSTARRDEHEKLIGYFGLPSVRHYLIVYAERRILVHHARRGEEIATRILHGGPLRLDPPVLDLNIEDLLGASPES